MHSSVDFASLCVGRICVSEDANVARQLSFFCLSLSLSDLSHVLSFLLSDSLGGKEREGGRGRTSEGARPQKKENNRRETSVDSGRERFETME
jgi:hypothetical protein